MVRKSAVPQNDNTINAGTMPAATPEKEYASKTQATVLLFTDPLCCWSYGMQESIDKIKNEFEQQLQWRICMTGMIPDWRTFADPVNNVTRPAQMGPFWMYVSETLGISLNSALWARDPPVSSYPACLAYHAVALQNAGYGWQFLKLLWNNCMQQGNNICNRQVLKRVAVELQTIFPLFDPERFNRQLDSEEAYDLLRRDFITATTHRISRLPSIVIKTPAQSILLTGYRAADLLREAFANVLGLQPR